MIKVERVQGCILGKPVAVFLDERSGCLPEACAACGFNTEERERRRLLIRRGALVKGPDGLKRLYLGR